MRTVRTTRGHGPQVHGQAREATGEVDHVIVLSQRHLERLLREFIDESYQVARPHQGLGGQTPVPQEESPAVSGRAGWFGHPRWPVVHAAILELNA